MDIFNEISLSELSNYPNPDIWKVLIVCLPKSKINTFFRFKKQPSDYFDNILGRNQVSVDHKSLAYSDGESESDIGDEDVQIDEKLAIKLSEIESWCDRIEYKIVRTWSKYDVHNELHNFQPHIIILFDVLLEWIRQIEVFKAIKQVIPIRVYMIVHKSSIEEQMYLSAVETEKEAFETLISEKAIIYMPGEGRHDLEEGNIELDSRKTDSYVGGNVIVDIREFGSELPLVLHKTGFIIQPVTLEIGDYVLTPDIGIERKSVSDLVSSLNSGRLYDQAMALARNYKNPFLLIEFNDNKLFNTGIFSQRLGLRRRGSNTFYVQSKLLLLTLHCSTLKILWSTSPRFTVRLFRELKKGKPDPDLQLVSTITSYESSDDIINVSTNKSFDVLLRLPGVTNKNCSVLARKVNNFSELSQLQKGEIENILGPEGEKLFQIFNTDINRLHE
ncbi:DNA repair endonuclease XPF [Thelohanellus kitauei]|uniref:DNA repair endonuclease XPF n=1 Tax=Thelohanellus kitauei TaxID=669202 RepID=A0A0C2MR15_THEKT|nr:DNA repair endonuclease XPF [Thelohanellus kitauei]